MLKTEAKPKKEVICAKICSNKKIKEDYFEMEITAPSLSKKAHPGQFVNVKIAQITKDPFLRIPLGIHSKTKNGIKLLYKVVGVGTHLLSKKQKGEEVNILGPLGNWFGIEKPAGKNKNVLLVAGGHGIAPLYFLAEELVKQKRDVTVFLGACTSGHILCERELKKLGAKVHVATDDGSRGFKGYVTDLLKKYLQDRLAKPETRNPKHHTRVTSHQSLVTIYACGPRPMLNAVGRIAKENNLKAEVSLDAYMACGIGVCLGCAVKTNDGYKMVCKDGPVFDSGAIDWQKEAR